jgi:hypothetical protein
MDSKITVAPIIRLPYDEAWLYCACLYHDGYSDWRLPSWDEVYSGGDLEQHIPLWLSSDVIHEYTHNSKYNVVPVRTV